jgi:hypothetical protein
MKGERTMNKKVNIVMLSEIMFLLLLLSITGCTGIAGVAYNLHATDDLGGEKVLAGRILFYDNDVPVDRSRSGNMMFFHKEGDKKAKILLPDEDGYIYVPVTPGMYKFASVHIMKPMIASINFNMLKFPSVTVNDNDSAVNFGTYKVKFYLSGTEKVSAAFGLYGGRLEIEHVPDYDITRSIILAKIGTAMPLTDGKVIFVERVQNDPRIR